MSVIHSRSMCSDPIWSPNIYLIWQFRRNPPLPSNAVAMAFVEIIQTPQLMCEAWCDLSTLKMQNRKDISCRCSLILLILLSYFPIIFQIHFSTPCDSNDISVFEHFVWIFNVYNYESVDVSRWSWRHKWKWIKWNTNEGKSESMYIQRTDLMPSFTV